MPPKEFVFHYTPYFSPLQIKRQQSQNLSGYAINPRGRGAGRDAKRIRADETGDQRGLCFLVKSTENKGKSPMPDAGHGES
jgi:hypothetical protein